MLITLNGQPRELPPGSTILTLLDQLKMSPGKVAVEVNRRLRKSDLYGQPLSEGDEVEVVTFVGGG